MSMKTWKEEFYPITASNCSRENAVMHSLRKWQGLRAENLERHGVRLEKLYHHLSVKGEHSSLHIDNTSCSLCAHYYDETLPDFDGSKVKVGREHSCSECPLAKARNGYPCTETQNNEGTNPYAAFVWGVPPDPEPMIHWLLKS